MFLPSGLFNINKYILYLYIIYLIGYLGWGPSRIYSDLSSIPESKNLKTRLPEYLIGSKMFLHTLLHSDCVFDSLSGWEEIAIPTSNHDRVLFYVVPNYPSKKLKEVVWKMQ